MLLAAAGAAAAAAPAVFCFLPLLPPQMLPPLLLLLAGELREDRRLSAGFPDDWPSLLPPWLGSSMPTSTSRDGWDSSVCCWLPPLVLRVGHAAARCDEPEELEESLVFARAAVVVPRALLPPLPPLPLPPPTPFAAAAIEEGARERFMW